MPEEADVIADAEISSKIFDFVLPRSFACTQSHDRVPLLQQVSDGTDKDVMAFHPIEATHQAHGVTFRIEVK